MTLFHDTMPTVVQRMSRCLHLAWVLLVLTPYTFAFNTPQRPAALSPVKSTAEYNPGFTRQRGNRTYLAMVGPAALRFAEAPAELPPEPPVPEPVPIPLKQPSASAGTDSTPALTADPGVQPGADNLEKTDLVTPDPKGPKPVSILPDDTKQEIRAEDVLPFFQFPGAADSSSTANPFSTIEPVRAKPSSATYRQQ